MFPDTSAEKQHQYCAPTAQFHLPYQSQSLPFPYMKSHSEHDMGEGELWHILTLLVRNSVLTGSINTCQLERAGEVSACTVNESCCAGHMSYSHMHGFCKWGTNVGIVSYVTTTASECWDMGIVGVAVGCHKSWHTVSPGCQTPVQPY